MFSFHVKRAVKIKLFHVKHRLFLRFSPLYIPLLPRFYLFYIHIIVLRYIAFSRYFFVVFMSIFALNHVLFYGVLQRVFVALFERISPCLAKNRARFIGFFATLPPSFSLSNRCFIVARCFPTLQQRRYVGWLVGWLVGTDSFGQIVACRSPIIAPVFYKMLSSGRSSSGFTSV